MVQREFANYRPWGSHGIRSGWRLVLAMVRGIRDAGFVVRNCDVGLRSGLDFAEKGSLYFLRRSYTAVSTIRQYPKVVGNLAFADELMAISPFPLLNRTWAPKCASMSALACSRQRTTKIHLAEIGL